MINRSARNEVDDSLRRNRDVFHDLISFQQNKLRQRAEELANEPTLRAILNSIDTVDAPFEEKRRTIAGVVNQLNVKASVFLITDPDGYLRYDRNDPKGRGDMSKVPLIEPALKNGRASGVCA